MKAATYHAKNLRVPVIPYPNAMTRKEMLHKILNLMLVAAIGAGCAASMLFLLAMV